MFECSVGCVGVCVRCVGSGCVGVRVGGRVSINADFINRLPVGGSKRVFTHALLQGWHHAPSESEEVVGVVGWLWVVIAVVKFA